MSKDNIFVDTKQFERLSIEFKSLGKQMPAAAASALNRTLDYTVTCIGRLVPREYAIKTSEVKASMKGGKRKATKTDLSASITSKGHTLSIAHFPHSPSRPRKNAIRFGKGRKLIGKGYDINVTIKRSKGPQVIRTTPKPFIASTGAKSADKTQYNVFRRIGHKRLPITVLRTLSIPQMIGNENLEPEIQEAAQKKLAERIEHEIEWRLNGMQRRIKG